MSDTQRAEASSPTLVMRFLRFMATPAGRWTRIASGAAIAALVLARRGTPRPIAIPGTVLALSGAFDFVPPSRLFGMPLRSRELRKRLGMPKRMPRA